MKYMNERQRTKEDCSVERKIKIGFRADIAKVYVRLELFIYLFFRIYKRCVLEKGDFFVYSNSKIFFSSFFWQR